MRNIFIALSGLILPGMGHVLAGRIGKGLLLFAVLTGMFIVGISFDTDYFHRFGLSPLGESFEAIQDKGGSSDEGLIDRVWKYLFTYVFPFVVGIGTYLIGFFLRDMLRPAITALPFIPDLSTVPVSVKDIGYCFALLSGLLNILVMMDSYDIAFNAQLFNKADGRREKWLK